MSFLTVENHSRSHSPATTEYFSLDDESESDQTSKACILASTGAATLHTESPTTRALLCINAARILLLETHKMGYTNTLKPFRRGPILHHILSLGLSWINLGLGEIENANDILELPIFSTSLEAVQGAPLSCSQESVNALVKQLQRMAACAVIDGDNDTIVVLGLPAERHVLRKSFIVFNPRCRSSVDLMGASLRHFPTPEDTARHIFSLLNIYKSPYPDGPVAICNALIFRLAEKVFTEEDPLASVYQANMILLRENRQVEITAAKEGEARREMNRTTIRIQAVEEECKRAFERRDRQLEEASFIERQLSHLQAVTAAMFGEVLLPDRRWEDQDVEMDDLTSTASTARYQRPGAWSERSKGSFKSPPSTYTTTTSNTGMRSRFMSGDSSGSEPKRASTPGTPPDTLWNPEQEAIRLEEQRKKDEDKRKRDEDKRKQDEEKRKRDEEQRKRDEEAQQEILRLQALQEQEELSLRYAQQLAMEEEEEMKEFEALKEANKSFECPLCIEEYHESFMVRIEPCDHVVCRDCVLQHVKAQVEETHWPIFCPMCPGTLERRGIVTRQTAELVGGDEKLFEGWNRMELGSVSIALECPRCKETTRVDSQDFREADVLDCPLGCGAHWCKDCHQEVERGKKHSCDGQAEFEELAKAQNWRACPGCGAMAERISGCNQLTCKVPGCNSHFCYVCGGMIAKTASISEMLTAKGNHYRTCRLWN